MGIPVESSEIQAFTPESLKETMGDSAPVFHIKAPSERAVRRFRQLIGDDGLEIFSQGQFDAEKLRAIDMYWSEDIARQYKDQFKTLLEKQKQNIDLTEEELAWLSRLEDQIYDLHSDIKIMARKTGEFKLYSPRHAFAAYITGWDNLDVPFRLKAGVVDADTITAMTKALERLGKKHCPDAPGLPFVELYADVGKRLNMDEDEEKNSPAPSPDISSPDASTASVPKDGASTAESAAAKPSTSRSKRKKAPANG